MSEAQAPASVSRLEHLRTLRNANLDGAFAAAFGTLVGGAFIVKYGKHLGASDLWIGLVTAIPALLGLLQIPGAIWGRSFNSFKKFVLPGGLAWRILHAPLIILPFLPISNDFKLLAILGLVGLAAMTVQVVGPIYNDWLAEMIPSTSRGWFFSRRNAIMASVGAAAALLGGIIFDVFEKQKALDVGFSVTCCAALIFSIVSQFFFNRMTDIPRSNPLPLAFKTSLAAMGAPFKDRAFRLVLIFFTLYIIAQSFAGNLFAAYAFESIKMDMTVFQVAAIAHASGNVLASKLWGYFSDRYGNKPLLVIGTLMIALTPLQWVFLQPGQPLLNGSILFAGHLFTGMAWAGVALCQYNLLLATAPQHDRPSYLGAGQALQAVMGAVGPLMGAAVMSMMRNQMPPEQAYHTIFYITMALRFSSLILLIPIQEQGATSIRSALSDLSKLSPAGFRALRKVTQSELPEARLEAIAGVAERGLELARDEVIKALHDPNPSVRRQAAASLAQLGGESSVTALVHMVSEHPDLVDEEIIEALGRIGHTMSIPSLLSMLQSPRPSLRRAVASALGNIGGPEASKALKELAQQREDPDVLRAALQSLRRLRAQGVTEEISKALLHPLPSVRMAAAEAVSDLELKEAVSALRSTLELYQDESSSEAAYALGAVGDITDGDLILAEAEKSKSMITRRRCLLGFARLHEVERPVYRIFLLESMEQDSALVMALAPEFRSKRDLKQALDLYTNNKQQEALVVLAKNDERIQALVERPVEEAFIVAAFMRCHPSTRN